MILTALTKSKKQQFTHGEILSKGSKNRSSFSFEHIYNQSLRNLFTIHTQNRQSQLTCQM